MRPAPAPDRTPTPPASGAFRADLGGLRGVAVLLVALYHVFVGRVSGGVDVFLLMSAFFLTSGWVRSVEAGRARTVAGSWLKRLRGLLPAAALTLLAVLAAALLLLPATRWRELLDQAWACLTYTQNLHLQAAAVDYYAADHSTASPLQHFWSLSVQGQIFLLWPLLLAGGWWFVRRGRDELRARALYRRVMLVVFSVLGVASFGYSVWFTDRAQAEAYFSLPARVWEFALGSVLALVLERLADVPLALRRIMGWAGLAALVTCGMVLRVEGQFPGYAALWPTLAAAAVILAGAGAGAGAGTGAEAGRSRSGRADVGWWLSRRPATWLGEISYPLYLWHWPVLVITLAVLRIPRPGPWLGIAILAASLGAAWATHRLLERPLAAWVRTGVQRRPRRTAAAQGARRSARDARRGGQGNRRGGQDNRRAGQDDRRGAARPRTPFGSRMHRHRRPVLVVLACLLAAVPVAGVQAVLVGQERAAAAQPQQDNPGALSLLPGYVDEVDPEAPALPLATQVKDDWANPGEDCTGTWATDRDELPYCQEGGDPDADVTVVMIGDSHAQQWTPALDVAAEDQGWRWVLVNLPGCRYGSDEEARDHEGCQDFTPAAQDYVLQRAADVDAVITIGTKTAFGAAAPESTPGDEEEVPAGYRAAIRPWLKAGLPVVGVRDTPRFGDDQAECAAARRTDDADCTHRVADLMAPRDPLSALTQGRDRLEGFSTMDLTDVVCPDGVCTPVVGNVRVWMDDSHLTARFAGTAGTIFESRLLRAMAWCPDSPARRASGAPEGVKCTPAST